MEAFEKGKYSGNVMNPYEQDGVLACITSYNHLQYNQAVHYHENMHLSYVLEGGCVETKKDSYEITPGTLTFYHAGEHHQVLKVARPTRRINIELSGEFFGLFDVRVAHWAENIHENPDVPISMINIFRELTEPDTHSLIAITECLLKMVMPDSKGNRVGQIPPWVPIVREYLRAHLSEPVTLQEISKIANVHPVTISKNFARYSHCTLSEYIRKLRVEKALALVKASDASLTGIAYECGFFDQSHFIRAFKKCTGFLPSDLRAR